MDEYKVHKETRYFDGSIQKKRPKVKQTWIATNQMSNCVTKFYQANVNSRLCPGKKDSLNEKIDNEQMYK